MDIHIGYTAFEVRAGTLRLENVSRVLLPALGPTPKLILDLEFNGIRDALSALGSFGEKRRLEIRAAEQMWDVAGAAYELLADRFVLDVTPVSFIHGEISCPGGCSSVYQEGKPARAAAMCRYRADYYAAYQDGKQLWEIDPPNRRCMIGGVDYSGEMRRILEEGQTVPFKYDKGGPPGIGSSPSDCWDH